MSNRYCTVPDVFGIRGWFEKRFHEICEEHDTDYVTRRIPRRLSDRKLFAGFIAKDYLFLGIAAYIIIRLTGWMWYYWDSE